MQLNQRRQALDFAGPRVSQLRWLAIQRESIQRLPGFLYQKVVRYIYHKNNIFPEKEGDLSRPLFAANPDDGLQRVVHVELDRMRGHAEASHFLHLQFDIGVNHGVAEYTAAGQELAVLVQILERLVE